HLAVRHVGDVALAEERQQMVLAETVEIDVADNHHLAVFDGEERAVDDRIDVGLVAAREGLERLLDATWRLEQSLAIWILTQVGEQLSDQILHRDILPARPEGAARSQCWLGGRLHRGGFARRLREHLENRGRNLERE